MRISNKGYQIDKNNVVILATRKKTKAQTGKENYVIYCEVPNENLLYWLRAISIQEATDKRGNFHKENNSMYVQLNRNNLETEFYNKLKEITDTKKVLLDLKTTYLRRTLGEIMNKSLTTNKK
jgi:hypothetical protein